MWPVSDRFKQSIPQNHTDAASVTLTTPDGTSTPLAWSTCTVTCDSTQRVRRTASLTVRGSDTLFAQLSMPGARIAISAGIAWSGTDRELVPLIVGELSSAARQLGNGLISINAADLWQRVAAANFLTTYTPAATARRVDEIAAAVVAAVPGTTVVNTSSDTGTVGSAQSWPSSRDDMIQAFAIDGGSEAFFLPDGRFCIRNLPQPTDTPAWVFKPGDGGTITNLTRNRPLDRLYNTVVVQPSSVDGSQSWTQVVAQISDTSNPRHPNYIGVRPYLWQSPTLLTTAQAQTVAGQLLAKVQGSTETLALGALSNPALEAGDVVRITNPTDKGYEIITHLLDGFTLDLAAGEMTADTRAARALA